MQQQNVKCITKYWILNSVLLCALRLSFAQTQSEFKTFYYPNGLKSSEGTLIDAKPNGYWYTYYENGNKRTEGNRSNFELDSLWIFYNEQGKIQTTIEYHQGKKNGWKQSYNDSVLLFKEYYKNDLKEAWSYTYYPNGKLQSEYFFDNGKQDDFSYRYSDIADTLISEISLFKQGVLLKKESINTSNVSGKKEGVWKWFYNNKVLKAEGCYSNGLLHGYYKTYDNTGKLKEISKYENGVKVENAPELAQVEMHQEYFPNKKVKSSGAYLNNKKEGAQRFFDEEGKIIATKFFKGGEEISEGLASLTIHKNGEWNELYDNKQIKVLGNYKNDVKTGTWIYYFNNGQIEQSGAYNDKGQAIGDWKWYYNSGKILRSETFENGVEEGILTEYAENGSVISKGLFAGGLKEGFWIYEMGAYKETGAYKEDLKEGIWKHSYTDNGKTRFEGAFKMGNAAGRHKYYYPSGNLKCDGLYVGGMKNGDWNYYNEAGEIEKIITFRNDEEYKINGLKLIQEQNKNEGKKQ